MCIVNVIDPAPPSPRPVSGTTPSLARASRSQSLDETSKVFVEVQEDRCGDMHSTRWIPRSLPPKRLFHSRCRPAAASTQTLPSHRRSAKDDDDRLLGQAVDAAASLTEAIQPCLVEDEPHSWACGTRSNWLWHRRSWGSENERSRALCSRAGSSSLE